MIIGHFAQENALIGRASGCGVVRDASDDWMIVDGRFYICAVIGSANYLLGISSKKV